MISRCSYQDISKLQNKINTRLFQRSWNKHLSFLLKRFNRILNNSAHRVLYDSSSPVY